MLIVNDEHCLRAGIKSLSKRCTRVSWGNEITIFQANREKNKWERSVFAKLAKTKENEHEKAMGEGVDDLRWGL